MKREESKNRIRKVVTSLATLMFKNFRVFLPLILLLCINGQLAARAQFVKPLISGGSQPLAQDSVTATTAHAIAEGQSIATNSTAFPSMVNPLRTTVYVYTSLSKKSEAKVTRYMVLTIRPSSLTAEQVSDINDILGINMLSGQQSIEADASKHQLELIQAVLAPSPNDSSLGLATLDAQGRKMIGKDPTPQQWAALRRPADDPLYTYSGPIPAAKPFARTFVIIGLVAATIYVAFAAYSIITGQAHGGSRVLNALAGLMLLLMGYTIYKIMIMNAVLKNGVIETKAISTQLPLQGTADEKYREVAGTPKVPTNLGSFAPRSGLQVQPLSGR